MPFHKNKLWSVLDLAVAGIALYCGIRWMQAARFLSTTFALGVLGFAVFMFGVATALTALFQSAFFTHWWRFFSTFIGRGIAFVIVGSLEIGDDFASLALGIATIVVGIVYVALQFVNKVPQPEPLFAWGGRKEVIVQTNEGIQMTPSSTSSAHRHTSAPKPTSSSSAGTNIGHGKDPNVIKQHHGANHQEVVAPIAVKAMRPQPALPDPNTLEGLPPARPLPDLAAGTFKQPRWVNAALAPVQPASDVQV